MMKQDLILHKKVWVKNYQNGVNLKKLSVLRMISSFEQKKCLGLYEVSRSVYKFVTEN